MPDIIAEVAEDLYACVCAQVALLADPPNRCCLLAGATFELGVAINEDMCRCGTAWVRVASVAPSVTFPSVQEEPRNCRPPMYAVTLEMGVARCPPIGTTQDLPTCPDWLAYSRKVLDDAAALRKAVFCCFGPMLSSRGLKYVLGAWEPFGPEGLCGGGIQSVTVPVMACDECG